MDNNQKLIILREILYKSRLTIDTNNIPCALKNTAVINFIPQITMQSTQTTINVDEQFNSTFPQMQRMFNRCDSLLNPSMTGAAIITMSQLNLDLALLSQGSYSNVFEHACAGTGDWHTHHKHGSLSRSFTIHFPVWAKDPSILLSDIEYSVDFIEDFSIVEKYSYEDAKVVANKMLDEGKVTRIFGKNVTFLDFRSSFLHRGFVPKDVILCSIVFNYRAKSTNPDILNPTEFRTNMTFDECYEMLPLVADRCNTNFCIG